jgi:hypothetical protein
MPRRPTSLRDPRVVIVVAVLFLIVAAVNLETFLPLRGLGHRSTATQAEPFTPPSDAAELTRLAATHGTGTADAGLLPAVPLPPPADRAREPRATVVAPRTAREPESTAASPLPSCTAILGTGAQPVALIAGARRRVGDAVGDWLVTAISVDGATLQGPTGTVFLPVGTHEKAQVRFSLVTKAEATLGAGSTALQPQTGSREP